MQPVRSLGDKNASGNGTAAKIPKQARFSILNDDKSVSATAVTIVGGAALTTRVASFQSVSIDGNKSRSVPKVGLKGSEEMIPTTVLSLILEYCQVDIRRTLLDWKPFGNVLQNDHVAFIDKVTDYCATLICHLEKSGLYPKEIEKTKQFCLEIADSDDGDEDDNAGVVVSPNVNMAKSISCTYLSTREKEKFVNQELVKILGGFNSHYIKLLEIEFFAILRLQESPLALESLPNQYLNNKKVILFSVSHYGKNLRLASDSIRKDKEVALAAIENDAQAWNAVSDVLKQDPKFVKAALKKNGLVLQFVDDKFKVDFASVLTAVQSNGLALQFAPAFQNNRTIVLEAVKQSGLAYKFASKVLQEDEAIILQAIEQNDSIFEMVPENKKVKEFILKAIKVGLNFETIVKSKSYQNLRVLFEDPLVIVEVLKKKGVVLKHVNEEFQKVDFIVKVAVEQDGTALEFARTFQANKNIVLIAIAQSQDAWQFVSETLSGDKAFQLEALRFGERGLYYLPDSLQNDEDFILSAIKINYHALLYASEALRSNLDFISKVVKVDPRSLQHASDELENDIRILKLIESQKK